MGLLAPGAAGDRRPAGGDALLASRDACAAAPSITAAAAAQIYDFSQAYLMDYFDKLKYGFTDSHFICFPYESRRTGIYPAGPVRRPMDIAQAMEDATGATMKAIQAVAREFGLDGRGFYVRANAAGPGVTPHMHWHIMGQGIP